MKRLISLLLILSYIIADIQEAYRPVVMLKRRENQK